MEIPDGGRMQTKGLHAMEKRKSETIDPPLCGRILGPNHGPVKQTNSALFPAATGGKPRIARPSSAAAAQGPHLGMPRMPHLARFPQPMARTRQLRPGSLGSSSGARSATTAGRAKASRTIPAATSRRKRSGGWRWSAFPEWAWRRIEKPLSLEKREFHSHPSLSL
jgi:hypothetical protein